MNHKKGDKVRIKSIAWYQDNKDSRGRVSCGDKKFIAEMSQYCDKILTIEQVFDDRYIMKETDVAWSFNDLMINDKPTIKLVGLDKSCEVLKTILLGHNCTNSDEAEKIIEDFRKKMMDYEHNGC